jgi:hypothetical protein
LLDAAHAEARNYLNASSLPAESDVSVAVLLLLRAKFDLDDARDMARYRSVAESLLQPYRIGMGV